jgi:hemolysin activation/secretion protein
LTGHKLGVGAGVRLSLKDGLTLRVDWARAVGESAEVGRSGRLYLTVSSARTL